VPRQTLHLPHFGARAGLTYGQEHGGSPSQKIAPMIATACAIAWSRTAMPARALEELGRL
jgi:hypothetical protein